MTGREQKLQDRVALVTGAGNGIGRAIVELFAAQGAIVIASDIDADAADAVAADINASGGHAMALAHDVTQAGRNQAVLTEIGTRHGRLDILVNNAGLNVRADLRHLSDDDWAKIRATNLDSVVQLSRDGFALLQASGSGVILNIASIMGSRSLRQLAGYSATKAAVMALTRSLAVEYAPYGIRANYVAPGFIETALTARFMRNPLFSKGLLDQTPLRRFGSPDEVAKAALFLVSADAGYITGTGLVIDGGMSAAL